MCMFACGYNAQEEIPSIVDCPNPDHMTPHERRIGRVAGEEVAFSPDHYLYEHTPPCHTLTTPSVSVELI